MSTQAKIIDGKFLAEQIRQEVKEQIGKLGIHAGLAVILVGHNPASELYVSLKAKAAREVGIMFSLYKFEDNVTEQELLDTINWLNEDSEIDAILVQLPLPPHLDENKIISTIDPKKDVDGLHPVNVKNFLANQSYLIPGLASGIMQLLTSTNESLSGRLALLVARGPEFSSALAHLFAEFGLNTKIIHPDEANAKAQLRSADIIVVAIGEPKWLKAEDIKKDAIVIDVGTNRLGSGEVVGDVDFAACAEKAGWISPVPGGVGPMTVAMLLKNTVALAVLRQKTLDRQ